MPNANSVHEAIREAFASLGGVQRKSAIAAWIRANYPEKKWADSTVSAQMYGACVNVPSAYTHRSSTPKFLYYRGAGDYEIYDPSKHGTFVLGQPQGDGQTASFAADSDGSLIEKPGEPGSTEFAYEAHLRDYLARNLHLLEKGLTLWSTPQESVEYGLAGRRVDILGKDDSGVPVVIELKLSRGHERVLGQALLYRGLLKHRLNVPRVRLMLIASEITEELQTASAEVSDVELFEYLLTMQINRLETLPLLS